MLLKFMNFIEKVFMPPMTKLAQQTHLKAIRNGMVVIIPLVIVGSFFLIALNLPIPGYPEFIEPYKATLDIPFRMTVSLMAIYATFGIGSALGRERGLDPVNAGVLATVAFFMTLVPLNIETDAYTGWTLPYTYLGSAGLFGSIIVSLLSVDAFYYMKKRNLTIKMPEQVPASVSDSFAALFPTALVVVTIFFVVHVIGFDIHAFVNKILAPFSDFLAGENIFGALFTVILITMLWAAGIHGVSVIGGILRPFWQTALETNATEIANGTNPADVTNVIVEPFYQWFVWIGGSGGTLGLIIACILIAKSKMLKEITKVSAIPSIFNINEPVIFGFPIVMNPALIIPFILGPVIVTIISYYAIQFNFVTAPYILAPWTLPGPIGALLATADFRAMLLCIINLVILVIVYLPFVKIYDKQMLAEENNA